MCVECEEDGFEAGLGSAERDAGEVEAGDDWDESEDDELEIWIGGLEGVVEPATKVVVAGAGVGESEEGGDLGRDVRVVEEREGEFLCGGCRGGERGRDCGEDGGEGLNSVLDSGDRS